MPSPEQTHATSTAVTAELEVTCSEAVMPALPALAPELAPFIGSTLELAPPLPAPDQAVALAALSDNTFDERTQTIGRALYGLPPYESPLSKRSAAQLFGLSRYAIDEVDRRIRGEQRPLRKTPKKPFVRLTPEEAKVLFDDRDAGLYASILDGLRRPVSREKTIRTLRYNLSVGASQRQGTRTRSEKAAKQPPDHDERYNYLARKRAYNDLLDSRAGHDSLVSQLVTRATALKPREVKLLAKVIARGEQAQAALTDMHIMLVLFTANLLRVSLNASSIEVLPMDAGYRGLRHAVKQFDPAIGFTFASYAMGTIRGALLNAYNDERAQTLSTTRTYLDRARRARALESSLAQTLGCTPTDEDIAAALGVKDAYHVQELRDILNRSFSVPLGGMTGAAKNTGSLSDILEVKDTTMEDAQNQFKLHSALEMLGKTVNLTDQERVVLHGSFGVHPYTHALSEAQLCELLQVPQRTVRNIFQAARAKMSDSAAANTILTSYLRK